MSQPSRPRTRGPVRRLRRDHRIEDVRTLEERALMAPYVSAFPRTATFTANANNPTDRVLGTVAISTTASTTFPSAAPFTSVSELTPISSFGGDIVSIAAGPGGDFGAGVYAVSRGAGGNTGAVNRPGVIYRVDPATGKSSVFFDLTSVINQIDPGGGASNPPASGYSNWYAITFDPEGYFDGRTSMFVSVSDRTDPAKNTVYRIAPDGTFMGAFTQLTDGQSAGRFNANPTAIYVAPPEQQTFLRGLFTGGTATSGTSSSTSTTATFSALFFDANAFRPGTNVSSQVLPTGVSQTNFTLGPQVGFASANSKYTNAVYSAFTDFGTPAAGGIPARAGDSGIQGLDGTLLINNGVFPNPIPASAGTTPVDQFPSITTDFRRFQSVAFDKYGYFSSGVIITSASTTSTTGSTSTTYTYSNPPVFAGSLFVSDLGTGLSVQVTAPGAANPTLIPVQGRGATGVINATGGTQTLLSGGNLGGRIVRISPAGTVYNFAEGFNTSGSYDSTAFTQSSLTISFSADGTILYASDNDGIWQFKTTGSLAGSTSGSLVGLNDLRSLGVPYDGQGSAVAVVDTGVDAQTTGFRGRVAPGSNVITNGYGNDDTAPGTTSSTTTGGTTGGGTTGGGGLGGGGGGNTGGTNNGTGGSGTVLNFANNGHGTLVAGIITQFVPQATIVPVNIFNPFSVSGGTASTGGTGGTGGAGGGGTGNGGTGGGAGVPASNATSSSQAVYNGLGYVAANPYVKDPIRPGRVDRVVAANLSFGSIQTFDSEGSAYRQFPQIVIAFKNQLKKFRSLGIAPIAAAGNFGAPLNAGSTTTTGGGGGGAGGTGGGNNLNTFASNNAGNSQVGDVNGISLPAVLNEVISVTGVIPFPYVGTATSTPNDPVSGVAPRPLAPFLANIPGYNPGSVSGTNGGGGTGGTGGGNTGNGGGGGGTNTINSTASAIIQGNISLYSDRLVAGANRSTATDYAAPAVDVPTYARSYSANGNQELVYDQGGTSLASAVATGSYALIASALDYWVNIANSGVTSDAYLTQPVSAKTLNFGKNSLPDFKAYTNPDGINSILSWTAVPALDANDGLTSNTPANLFQSPSFKSYARIDLGNAIAAIEGYVATNYLTAHNSWTLIDSNKDGLITAQELQNFEDTASTIGQSEAGAMARLLGGTAKTGTPTLSIDTPTTTSATGLNENPDQPDVLQRRFNFFDYAADGQLNGSVSIQQYQVLSKNLLPAPTAGVIVDRQRASANGFLVAPNAQRNFRDLQHIQPKYQWVPASAVKRFRGVSPATFGVDRGQVPGTSNPVYALMDTVRASQLKKVTVRQGKAKSTVTVGVANNGTTTARSNPTVTVTTQTADNSKATGTLENAIQTVQGNVSSTHPTPSSVVSSTSYSLGSSNLSTVTAPAKPSPAGTTVNPIVALSTPTGPVSATKKK